MKPDMSKKIIFLLPILCLFLSSCFEITETYSLKEDGSYTASYNVNLNEMLGMLSSIQLDPLERNKLHKDTILNVGSQLTDEVKNELTGEQQVMMNKIQLRLQIKPDSIFQVGFSSEGKSVKELKYYLENFMETIEKS